MPLTTPEQNDQIACLTEIKTSVDEAKVFIDHYTPISPEFQLNLYQLQGSLVLIISHIELLQRHIAHEGALKDGK
jgi:hypothetical protein